MKHWLAALGLSAAFLLAPALLAPAVAPAAAEEPGESEEAGEFGIERLMRALEAFIDMIPQYEMPEINENGDIIIRRKRHVEPAPEEDGGDDLDRTQT
jgi:hypothetical protein